MKALAHPDSYRDFKVQINDKLYPHVAQHLLQLIFDILQFRIIIVL